MRVAEFWIVTACLYKTNNHEAMTAAVCVLKTIIEQRDGVLDLQSNRLAMADAVGIRVSFTWQSNSDSSLIMPVRQTAAPLSFGGRLHLDNEY